MSPSHPKSKALIDFIMPVCEVSLRSLLHLKALKEMPSAWVLTCRFYYAMYQSFTGEATPPYKSDTAA